MFEVTMRDIKEARRCLAQDVIKRSVKGVFRGILFCLLSIGQLYKTQRTIYNTLVRCGLDSAEAIRDREQITKAIVWSARFPSSMWGYVQDLCVRWPENAEFFRENFVLRGPEDVEDVFALRDELVARVKGFGYKVASLFLCLWGVRSVATIDVWAIRFLQDAGYPVSFNYARKGGLTKGAYLKCEQYLSREAARYDMSPAFFQALVWVKLSSWNKNHHPAQKWLPGMV